MSRRRRRPIGGVTTPEPEPSLSTEAEILTFTFNVSGEVVNIDSEEAEVLVTVPFGTDVEDLEATFTISENATSDPESPVEANFTTPYTIDVIAEDENVVVEWKVIVTVEPNVTATLIASVGSNLIETTTIYNNVSGLGDEWITDAFLQFSQPIPEADVIITVPAIGGNLVKLENIQPNEKIWLSDIIKEQNPAIPTRNKLNAETTAGFTIDVQTLIATGDLTITVITSNLAGLAGTRQSTNPLSESDYVVLATDTIVDAEFED